MGFQVSDFQVGDRIAHITMGDGKVVEVSNEQFRATFRNGRTSAVFDQRWLDLYPRYLFFREHGSTRT